MKKKLLSPEQAFDAMLVFLEEYYQRTKGTGEIGAVLGDIQRNRGDGSPMDPAAWGDWLAAVNRALEKAD
jgi:hypothetical protein